MSVEEVCFPYVNLREIVVPFSQCLGISIGESLLERVAEMKERDYDYALVYSSLCANAALIGLIPREHLVELVKTGRVLEEGDEKIIPYYVADIDVNVSLDRLLKKMIIQPAYFVNHEQDGGEYGSTLAEYGLVTRSDLNKHTIRALIYGIFAELEISLANLLLASTSDHMGWIRKLSEDSQARILGYWELSKLQNVNVGPVAGLMLSDLLNVIAKNEGMRTRFGFKSRKAFEDEVGCLPGVRNQIMHPVRPLVTNAESCRFLENTIRTALFLVECIKKCNYQKKP